MFGWVIVEEVSFSLRIMISSDKILPVFFIYNTPMQIGTDHVLLSLMTKNIFSKTNFTHHTIPKRSIGNWKVGYSL